MLPPGRHAQNKRQETAKPSRSWAVSGRSDSMNPPVPVGGSGGGRKFDAPPAAPPPTTMTDAVAPMDDGMEHENQSHKHPAYTIPGKPPIRTRTGQWHRSSRGTPVAWSRQCDWVLRASATCREWHGKQSPAAKKQPSASSFPLCLAQRTTRLCCIGVGLRGRRIKCQSTPFSLSMTSDDTALQASPRTSADLLCRQLVNFSPSRKISVSVLRFLSHPDLNIDFPGVCPGPAPLPPDLTRIPPRTSTLKSSKVLAAPVPFHPISTPVSPRYPCDSPIFLPIRRVVCKSLQPTPPPHTFNLFPPSTSSTSTASQHKTNRVFSTRSFQRFNVPHLQAFKMPGVDLAPLVADDVRGTLPPLLGTHSMSPSSRWTAPSCIPSYA